MTYLQRVKAAGAAQAAQSTQQKQATDTARAASWRDEMRPLPERLADLLKTIPDDVKATGLSLSTLQSQLRGRKATKAHCGEVATALRQLGYQRARVWKQSHEQGFSSKWTAPTPMPTHVFQEHRHDAA